ncbi:MAG: hypothetical protein AB1734_01415 [Elusimicrobiota bacterium]
MENLGLTSAMEGCTMLQAPVYNEVLVKAVPRPKEEYEGPGFAGWTAEYPIDLEYTPQTNVTLYHLSGGQVLVDTPEAYVPQYSAITVTADVTPGHPAGSAGNGSSIPAGPDTTGARLEY